jgi:hypothetical protein
MKLVFFAPQELCKVIALAMASAGGGRECEGLGLLDSVRRPRKETAFSAAKDKHLRHLSLFS